MHSWYHGAGFALFSSATLFVTQLVNLRGTMPLADALTALEQQTGNSIVDQRLQKTKSPLNLDLSKATFWQALDSICKDANVSFSPYRAEGAVAIVDGPYRPVPVSYSGAFRVAVKGVAVSQDFESATHTCTTHLEVAWEPRFQPFYLDVGPASLLFAADANGKELSAKVAGSGKQPVAQRMAVEIPIQTPAPLRSSPKIEHLKGKFALIGPTKMLVFKFADLKPRSKGQGSGVSKESERSSQAPITQNQEGVKVTLTQVAVASDRWSFDVLIQNPPGVPEFESYQHWLHNNQIYLEKGNGKQVFRPNAADEQQLDLITAHRAAVRYHFSHRGRAPEQIGQLSDWTLVYHTPGAIVQVEVPYEFSDVPLP